MVKTFCNLFDRLLKIAEVQKHTALFAAVLQFVAAYLYFHNPVMTVNICALAVISVKKVRAVKTSLSFYIIHISPFAQKKYSRNKTTAPKKTIPIQMPWFCLTTGWRKRTVCLIGYIIPRRNAHVNPNEALKLYLFSEWR
jgi:hypothetical protein